MRIEIPVESLSDIEVWHLSMLLGNGAQGCSEAANRVLACIGEACRSEQARRRAIDLIAAETAMTEADPVGSIWNEPWRDQNGTIV